MVVMIIMMIMMIIMMVIIIMIMRMIITMRIMRQWWQLDWWISWWSLIISDFYETHISNDGSGEVRKHTHHTIVCYVEPENLLNKHLCILCQIWKEKKFNLHKGGGHRDDTGIAPPTAEVCGHHHKHRRTLKHLPNLWWQNEPFQNQIIKVL